MPSPEHRASGLIEPSDRLLLAYRLYRAGKAPLVICSGGDNPVSGGSNIQPEAAVMCQLLEEWGVPAAAVQVENGSINTRENAVLSGLAQSPQGPSFITIPEQKYADNVVRRTGILTLDGNGGVTGKIQIAMTGQEALRWRQTALENDDSEVKKQFDDELAANVPDGVLAHVDHFEAIDNANTNLVAVVNIEGTLGVSTAKRLVIPGFFFETRGHIPFVNEEKRILPVDMHYGERVTDQITYRLPAGFTVEGAPADANISWPNHALFVAKSLTQASQITIAQTLTRAFTLAKPEEYQDLRGFYQKVAAADEAQLVLAIAPAGKSN